ncbi:MAG: CehA/McbA family metallohydrolase [Gemmatimonadota bacterium]
MHLTVTVTDAATSRPLPCRLAFCGEGVPALWGRDAAGQDLAYSGTPRLWCDGHWEGDLPDGPVMAVVSRPYEYATRVVPLESGPDQRLEVALERRCHLAAAGWHCGDAHQHVVHGEALRQMDLPRAAAVARAEGMDWVVFDGRFTSVAGAAEPDPAELDRLCLASSVHGFTALWADEYPKHDLGHLAAFPQSTGRSFADLAGEGIYRLGPGDRTPYTSFESVRTLHRHGSLAVYVHPPRELGGTPERVGNIARELPLDTLVAPWSVEAVDLLSDRIDDPLCWRMWFGWLNRGLRVGLCAFNDACYDRAGPGWCEPVARRRTYARLDGPPGAAAIARAVRRGRTFGTTGPLLLFEVAGHGPGSALPADGLAHKGRLRAWAAPDHGDPALEGRLRRLMVYRNGEPYQEWALGGPGQGQVDLAFEVAGEGPAWYLARAEGTLEDQLAVTSPVYVGDGAYRPPAPYPAAVRVAVVDAATGRRLDGQMELVEFACDRVEVVEARPICEGAFAGAVPGDLRLRARVEGYAPQVLSPILDHPPLYRDLLGPIRAADLADPAYYERLRRTLDRVELRFEMVRA